MAVPRVLPAVLGVVALLLTFVMLFLLAANAHTPRISPSPAQRSATAGAVFESFVLVALARLVLRHFSSSTFSVSEKQEKILVASTMGLSILAMITSIATLSLMKDETYKLNFLHGSGQSFVTGSAIMLTMTFLTQLIFIILANIANRGTVEKGDETPMDIDEGGMAWKSRIKTVRYSRTMTEAIGTGGKAHTFDLWRASSMESGIVAREKMASVRKSVSMAVRPISSKTRLLSTSSRTSSRRRTTSLSSSMNERGESGPTEAGFDSWDCSRVDDLNRQLVLETIPDVPSHSQSPTPEIPFDLEPPRRVFRRSGSSNLVGTRSRSSTCQSTHSTDSELHIHPLFRSDSPDPPAITPGTMVVASPNAGSTMNERTLHRMCSGSLPTQPSPLRVASVDRFSTRSPSPGLERSFTSPEESLTDRVMTPPLPEWIMNAGSRTSLAEYHLRRRRDHDEQGEELCEDDVDEKEEDRKDEKENS